MASRVVGSEALSGDPVCLERGRGVIVDIGSLGYENDAGEVGTGCTRLNEHPGARSWWGNRDCQGLEIGLRRSRGLFGRFSPREKGRLLASEEASKVQRLRFRWTASQRLESPRQWCRLLLFSSSCLNTDSLRLVILRVESVIITDSRTSDSAKTSQ